jgi:hypothetical protein
MANFADMQNSMLCHLQKGKRREGEQMPVEEFARLYYAMSNVLEDASRQLGISPTSE